MKRKLLKFSMFIKQSYLHNPSKESTPQRDVKQCDVIFSDVILWSAFAQWKSEKLKQSSFVILRVIKLIKIISTIVFDRDVC